MIYLVRHTTPLVAPGVCFGQSDVGVAASYAQEREIVRARLPKSPFRCYSSPLKRCLRLANDLYPTKVVTDPRLVELNFGDWEMKRWDEIDQAAAAHWGDHFVTERCPGGESFLDLQQRIMQFWNVLLSYANHGDVVVVMHAGPMRVIVAQQKGVPLSEAFNIPVNYGQVIAIRPKKFVV